MVKALDHAGELEVDAGIGSCRRKESMLSVARSRRTHHLCPVEWFHFVKQYSRAEFTHPRDRLLALSSVARAVEPIMKSEYLAGLWRGDLIRGLNWHCLRPERKNRCFPAPTWSWASVGTPVEFAVLRIETYPVPLVEILDIEIEPAPEMSRYEDIARGTLRVKGTLDHKSLPILPKNGYNSDSIVFWDEIQHDADGKEAGEVVRDYTLLPIGGTGLSWKQPRFSSLILEPIGETKKGKNGVTESAAGKYRRIGWTEYSFPEVTDWYKNMLLERHIHNKGASREAKAASREALWAPVRTTDAVENWILYAPTVLEIIWAKSPSDPLVDQINTIQLWYMIHACLVGARLGKTGCC